MDAPDTGTAPSASDASQSAASSADSTPSPAETTAPDTSASAPADDSSALASAFGVMDDGDTPPVGPVRDEKGRFAAKPADASPSAPVAAPAQPAAPAPEKFKLADLEFDSPEHAAQQVKTMRGMFKAADREVKDLRSELTNAINVANAWKAHAEGRAAQPPATTPPPGAPASAAADSPAEPNWDVLAHLANHPETGTVGALIQYHQDAQRLAEARDKALIERVTKEIEAKYSPVLASHAEQAELAEVGALVDQLADWTIEATGQPFFPELRDGQTLKAIGDLWRGAGHDNAALKTPQGLQAAIALHRMWTGYTPAAPATPSTQAPPPPAAPAPPGSADLALAMSGSAPPSVRPGGPMSPEQAARAAIRAADPVDAYFGVTP